MMAVLLAALPAAADVADPAAPIRRGKIRCGWPDVERKTCRSLARYTSRPGGGFDVSIEGLPLDDGLVLRYSSHARIDHHLLCVTITANDIALATFTKYGVTLIGTALARARDGMRVGFGPLLGREICDRDEPPGADGISNSVSFVEGQLVHDLDRTVKWVDPGDGYVLGPLPGGIA